MLADDDEAFVSSTAGTQYANRLASLYFLRHKNNLDAHLVFVNFVNAVDVGGPTSPEAWSAAYLMLHAALGLPERHPLYQFVHHVTLDVSTIAKTERL